MTGPFDLIEWVVTPTRSVVMLAKVAKVYEKLSPKDRGRLDAIVKKYAAGEDLPDTQFKFERREKVGDAKGTQVAVYAFKGWQKRIYGVELTDGNGLRNFVCSEIDVDKKQDKADQSCLKRAAQNVLTLIQRGWKT